VGVWLPSVSPRMAFIVVRRYDLTGHNNCELCNAGPTYCLQEDGMWKYILLVFLLFALSGCANGKSLEARADYYNKRKINACLCGDLQVGGGWGFTANGKIKGLVATGGTKIPECRAALPCD